MVTVAEPARMTSMTTVAFYVLLGPGNVSGMALLNSSGVISMAATVAPELPAIVSRTPPFEKEREK